VETSKNIFVLIEILGFDFKLIIGGRFKKYTYNRMIVPMPRRPTTTIGNMLEGVRE
jgi:hypothetical protein